MSDRVRVLYLGPWVNYGGTDKGTIDWFRWLDRDRYAAWLMTTQPSDNRRLAEVMPFAEEVWPLPELVAGKDFPEAIFALIHDREIDVLHIMNSRLGYDLLPDLGCLPNPPAVVVQLHVEEADRSGYVRYVTTRFGNLVDGFSVTSKQLAAAVEGYGVPRDRIRVVYTGVDTHDEFAPARVRPVTGLPAGEGMKILYPGRIVDQKDPMLMVEVAAALSERISDFQLHVVGEGDLESDVRRSVAGRGLEGKVRFHPPTSRLAPWYAACDVLLMTSVFEGVPYVIFEAMAMGLPVVAPALPGNRELVTADTGVLVDPRDDVEAYVEALATLADEPAKREGLGCAARERMGDHFSLRQMARDHERLYDDLLAGPAGDREPPPPVPTEIRFPDRPPYDQPLVSVVMPCFNHGRFIPDAIESVRAQTYPHIETIIVDDASTDPTTRKVLRELEGGGVQVLWLEQNGGPSIARNAALEVARGRYVLPLDADNMLLPDAITELVAQLQSAGERIGFIYPNLQYVGNRTDYFEAPDYNLHRLLKQNYCDTCSLFDRRIFDEGLRFPEDIRLGHEDWDFVLSLAERRVEGQAARTKTLLYRKWGFNRSDSVEYAAQAFGDLVVTRHPDLYRLEAEHKSRWSPAISAIALDVIGEGERRERLARRLGEQSALDFEYLARFDGVWPSGGHESAVPNVRRVPPQSVQGAAEMLAAGRSLARGPHLLAVAGTGELLLEDRAFVEKILRVFIALNGMPLDAIAFADAGAAGRFPFRLLSPDDDLPTLVPHAVAVRHAALDGLDHPVTVSPGHEVSDLVRHLVTSGARVQWRHAPAESRVEDDEGRPGAVVAEPRTPVRRGARAEREHRLSAFPAIPGFPRGAVPRWMRTHTYMPPSRLVLYRHRRRADGRRSVTLDRISEHGFELEYELGSIGVFPLEGTSRLVATEDGGVLVESRETPEPDDDGRRKLGYLEEAAFVGLDALILGRHEPTGQHLLVCGPDDPLIVETTPLQTLGYIEGVPISPRHEPHAELPYDAVGLVRCVDLASRRHRYGVGRVPPGRLSGELGSLVEEPGPGRLPVWVTDDGTLVTESSIEARAHPTVDEALRWILAPANWRDFSEPAPKARAIARRAVEATRRVADGGRARPAPNGGPPAGYLLSKPGSGSIPLYRSFHPVTGDQLLTRDPVEAGDMGYGPSELLGHLLAVAPVTGDLELKRVPVPWASRFGLVARRSL